MSTLPPHLSADEDAVFGTALHLLESPLFGDVLLLQGGQLIVQTLLQVLRLAASRRLLLREWGVTVRQYKRSKGEVASG